MLRRLPILSRNSRILLKQLQIAPSAIITPAHSAAVCSPRMIAVSRSNFSSSATVEYAKKKGKESNSKKHGKDAAESEEDVSHVQIADVVNLAELKTKFQATVDSFKEKTGVIRQGKFTPAVIEDIIVSTHNHTEEPLKNIARVALKGPRTMTVTVFEPSNVKHITAAVLASGLNLNPQPDPKSPEQILRIPLPPSTSETKKEIIKALKHEFEHFRNSPTKKSLTALREDALKQVKKAGKSLSKDQVYEVKNDVEELFKVSSKNLADALKQAEAVTMKD